MEEVVKIYTDGACRPSNPGPGGCACVMIYKGHRKELSLGFLLSTNSRMELMAAIMALESMKKKDIKVVVNADAKYVVDSVNKGWVFGWEKDEFRGRLNADLWKRFLVAYRTFKEIEFVWVKGHNGDTENEKCDKLANAAAGNPTLKDDGYANNK